MYVFSIFYVMATYALWWMVPDGSNMWIALIAFGIGMIAAEYALIFINAMLPSLGPDTEIGKLSGSGFALGYAGGVVALFIMLLLLAEGENGKTLIGLDPLFGLDASAREGTRSVGPFTAIWYAIEAFGLYALSGKATAFLAPALIGAVTYITSSARLGLSPVILLFIIALILLRWVQPEGDRAEWDGSSQA